MSTFRFALPPLAEQRRIVDLIEALDVTIAAAERGVGSAREVAFAARSHLFQEVSHCHESRPAAEVFHMLLGRQKSARQSVGDHVIPYLRAANVSSEGFRLDDVQTMNFSPAEQERYCLQAGDVMLVEGGSLGQSAIWDGELSGPVGFDKHVIRLRGVEGRSTADYALQWTRWAYEEGAFDAQARGVTIRALGFGRASSMPVPKLSVAEQVELVEPLEAADTTVRRSISIVQSLRILRSNLLTVLLSGEHQIPESYDELMEAV